MAERLRKRVYDVVDSAVLGNWRSLWFDRFMIVLILANVGAVILETVESLAVTYHAQFYAFELFSVTIFSVEYVARVWACVESPDREHRHPIGGRIRYILSPMALIDLIAIAPFFLSVFISVDLRFLRIFRLLRLLKLTRYSSALESIIAVVRHQRRALGAALLIMIMLLVFASSVVYLFEREAQPEEFASIPHAMWWALATLTTVGYGDVAPVTMWGKIFGGLIMVSGVGMFALPAGILTSGFADELRKRDFVVTWQLVARIPLFETLDAERIAEIAQLLQPRVVPADYTILRRGAPAESLFVIADGEVEIDVRPEPRRLYKGEFFGEIALLTDANRTATVTAITECRILVLDATDFRAMLEANPELHATLTDIMHTRLQELELSESDITRQENGART